MTERSYLTGLDDPVQCDSPGCFDRATVHFSFFGGRRVTGEQRTCKLHAGAILHRCSSGSETGTETPRRSVGATEFDLAFAYLDDCTERGKPPFFVCLHEAGGTRRFGYRTGFYECWALHEALQRRRAAYPSTHEAFRSAIRSLEGELVSVFFDDYVREDDRYCVSLRVIRAGTIEVAVSVRPSDAIILAVVCDVPVFANDAAISRLCAAGT